MSNTIDTTKLYLALVRYEAEREKILAKIAEIRAKLATRASRAATTGAPPPAKRARKSMPTNTRKRTAEEQKNRSCNPDPKAIPLFRSPQLPGPRTSSL